MIIRIIVQLLFVFILQGCVGLSHSLVNVPEISVIIKANVERVCSLRIISPSPYDEDIAVLNLLNNKKDKLMTPESNSICLKGENETVLSFIAEERYIGFVVPFSPSRDEMESRVLIIKDYFENKLFRIYIVGENVTEESVNLSLYENKIPNDLLDEVKGYDEEWYEQNQKDKLDSLKQYGN
jgi:hypothetical protein